MPMNKPFEAVQAEFQIQTLPNQGAWELDFYSGNFSWSIEMYSLFQCDASLIILTKGYVCDLFSASEGTKLNNWFTDLKSGLEIKPLDVEFVTNEGIEIFFRWTAGMFYDAFGSPQRAVGSIQDITALKNDEVKLFQYKHFFYESNDLNCIANVHGFFEKVNQKFSDLLGYSELDLVENSFLNFIHPDDLGSTLNEIEKLKNGVITLNFFNRYRKKNGDYVWLEWVSTPDKSSGKLYAIARDITERIGYENSLTQLNSELEARVTQRTIEIELRNKYFQALINNSSEAIMTFDSKGNILYQSPIVEKITGYTEKELSNKPALFFESGLLNLASQLKENKEGASKSVQFTICSKNGYLKWIEGIITKRLRDKNIHAYIFNFSDITFRKEYEIAISQSEIKLKKAQEIANFGSWELNVVTGEMIWSEVACRIHGFQETESKQTFETWISLIHPDDLNYVIANIKLSQETDKPLAYSYRILLKNKTIRYVNLDAFYEQDELRNIKKINGIINDVTEEKHAEKELLRSEMFTRGVLDSLTNQIAVIYKSGLVKETNKAWGDFRLLNGETYLMRTESGTNFIESCKYQKFSDHETSIHALEGISAIFKNKTNEYQYEYPLELANGMFWFLMRITKFKQDKSMLVISHEDITQRKVAELLTKKTANDLMHRNNELEQFAYMVSHNLRAPVANLIGLSDILINNHLPENKFQETTKGLFKSAHKLDEIIKDLNNVLQVRGHINEKKEIIYLAKLIKSIQVGIGSLVENSGLVIKADFKAIDRLVMVKSYIHSIFHNLIINSIKYRSDERKPVVDIISKKHNNGIVIRYKDNGIGFNMSRDKDHIFGMYKRFNPEIEGKGIGLYLVKLQVESLGGTIKLESELGKGAEFIIEFKN